MVSKISTVGILNKIVASAKGEVVRIYSALHKSYHKRFIPWTQRVRAATAKSVGTKLATLILNLPADVIAKLPLNAAGDTAEELAAKLADGLWAIILSIIAIAILRDIFIVPSDETVATYTIMKVPEQNGWTPHSTPRVESMDEIDFRFDAAFNEISIDAEDAGHSELISVPKCKTGIKRWAKPSRSFSKGKKSLWSKPPARLEDVQRTDETRGGPDAATLRPLRGREQARGGEQEDIERFHSSEHAPTRNRDECAMLKLHTFCIPSVTSFVAMIRVSLDSTRVFQYFYALAPRTTRLERSRDAP